VLLLALLIYVVAEVGAFVAVAEHLGILLSVILVLAISAFGPLLVRRAGLGALEHARLRLASGESPSRELLDGVVIVLGGILVCIPGFIGDVIGLALLIGPVRHLVIRLSGKALARRLRHNRVVRVSQRFGSQGPVIDVRTQNTSSGGRGDRKDRSDREILPVDGRPGEDDSPRRG
jgi:UPF0716 protein FxsA